RLLAAELLVEGGFASSRGGKRASLLRLNDQARWAIGGTVEAGRLSLVGVDMSGALRSRVALPLAAPTDATEVSAALDRALTIIVPLPAAPASTGMRSTAPSGPGADGRPLLPAFTAALDIPSTTATAPVCAALGSFWSGKQPENGLCATVHMDAGLGLSILQDGRPLQPSAGSGATLDHVVIDPDGPACECGGSGCLHQYA